MDTRIPRRHAITLESSPSASGEASAWALELAEAARLSEEQVYAMDLCIVEMVTNVVTHAYRGGAGEIRLELEVDPASASAVLTIFDQGPAFDPLALPVRAAPTSLDDASIGGYGIRLVRSTADACRYERRAGWNVFRATFSAAR